MRTLAEVKEAKALMTEAMDWSVIRWLREKKRVRRTADQANAALDRLDQAIRASWSGDLKAAYEQAAVHLGEASAGGGKRQPPRALPGMDAQIMLLAKAIRAADDAAHRARMDAEATFDEAERQLSTRLARDGCRKAIDSWDLHEKAIRQAETAVRSR
ncbi:MAG TPA: hypothetical protein VK473_09280 [Terriglobales bacterium]|nr:hypothetical protein [Terriglobales bacterium]